MQNSNSAFLWLDSVTQVTSQTGLSAAEAGALLKRAGHRQNAQQAVQQAISEGQRIVSQRQTSPRRTSPRGRYTRQSNLIDESVLGLGGGAGQAGGGGYGGSWGGRGGGWGNDGSRGKVFRSVSEMVNGPSVYTNK